jgi:hypothetical protein
MLERSTVAASAPLRDRPLERHERLFAAAAGGTVIPELLFSARRDRSPRRVAGGQLPRAGNRPVQPQAVGLDPPNRHACAVSAA